MTELRPHEPFFSIVIPTYNREDIVKRAIESCLCQSFQDFEIIVVDDGSSDATHASVLGFQDPRISYVWQPNAGGAVARNTGARKAQGKFLAFLDSDDAFDPEKLAVFHAQLCNPAADTERTVFYSPLKFWRGAENVVIRPDRPLRSDETVGEYLFAYDGLLQTSTLVLSRTLFDCVKFDPSLRSLQDLDLCLRLEAFGARFEMISEPLVIWFDVDVSNRISYSTKIDAILQWSATKRELLNDRAWAGFQARYVAPRVARRQPLHAIGLLWRAAAKRAVSPTRAVSLLMRGIAPGLYGRLRDTLVTLQATQACGGGKMSVVEDLRPAPQDVPYRAKTAANPDGMRVLHVTEAPLGGVAAYLEEIVQFQGGDPFASVEVLTPEINAPLLSKAAHPAVRIVQYKHRRKSIASLARLGWATFSRAWRTRPDIIHIHSTIAGGVVRAIRPVLPWKSRIVYCAHGWAFSRDGDRLKTRLVAQVERLLSLMTDQIICISQSEFKEAMRFGLPARKCVVIQNGVGASGPPDMSRRKTARGPKVIAFIGRFDHQKGFDTYINVLRRLGPDAKGIAVGQYIVSQQEDDTELPANLTVLGWMDREGVKKVMESADLLLMPSRWEGFGLVAVEAMRAGLPVFASRIGGPAEIVIPGHTGFLFDPEDPETIAELIRSQPADALHDMGQNGYYRYLELYTSERMNQRILDLYQSMARVPQNVLQAG